MSATLRCPSCQHRHDLGPLAGEKTFRCEECGQMLKVPAAVRSTSPTAAANRAKLLAAATDQIPATPAEPLADEAIVADEEVASRVVPWWARLLIWIVSVPLGAVLAMLIATRFGLFTFDNLVDAFLETTWIRFRPLAKLVPFWAIITALLVQGGVVLADRMMRSRDRRSSGNGQGVDSLAGAGDVPSPSRGRVRAS